jgi:hypothetical protein
VFLKVARLLLRVPPPRFSRQDALRIARATPEATEFAGLEPVAVEQLRTWLVWLDREAIGSPWLEVDQQTGEIVARGTPPR